MLKQMRDFAWNRLQRRRNQVTQVPEKEAVQTPLPANRGKPRVLVFIVSYPTFSESYMHEEIRALAPDFDIKIVTYKKSERPRRRAFEHTLVEYGSPCLVYAPFPKVNLEFTDDAQIEFIEQIDAIIRDFKPDLLHGHYLGIGVLLAKLAERHEIPFTVRTHSMDVLNEPDAKLDAYCAALNSPWCRRALAFPHSVKRLTDHGLNAELLESCWPVLDYKAFRRTDKREPKGRVICAGPAIKKKAHNTFVDLGALMKDSGYKFDLYAYGPTIWKTRDHNAAKGFPISIKYADPTEMPGIWPQYDWLVYSSDPQVNKVGLPCGVAEAMAAGVGVCWQELPGRRDEQLEFLGGAGFLFQSIEEVPALLAQPYPDEKRLAGIEAAKRFDIEAHKHLLTDVWNAVGARPHAEAPA